MIARLAAGVQSQVKRLIFAFAGLAAGFAFVAMPSAAQDKEPLQWRLPAGLLEISGLARVSEKSVFAHNDEHAIVYEVDLQNGEVVRAFAMGEPTVSGDFEGAAIADGRVYLITSDGRLYESLIGEHRSRVAYNVYDTGVGQACEVEGLSHAPTPGEFLILCKRLYDKKQKSRLVIYRWSLAERAPVEEPWLSIPYADFLQYAERANFRPAGIDWDPRSSAFTIVAARTHMLVMFDEKGALLGKSSLPADYHAQSEGIALMGDGSVIVADEGAGRGAGVLSIYRKLP
ncbi:MAG: hypothetical protein AAGD92_10625 [Pseudomonadota bacterium]